MPAALRFGVPLKEQAKPLDLPDELLHKRLANEFHVRYLESIGASPTPSNMAMARKAVPIDRCKFTTAWKSRGWNADYVYITPQNIPTSGAGARSAATILPHGGELQDLQAKLLEPRATAEVAQPMGGRIASKADDEDGPAGQTGAPKGPMSFGDAQRHFLYPFKSASSGAGPSTATASPRRRAREDGRDADAAEGRRLADLAGRFTSRDAVRYERYPPEEVLEELQRTLNVHTKAIVSLQAEFVHNFPFEKIRSRLSESEMRVALKELSCKRTTRFIGLVALLLYWTHLAPLTDREVQNEQLAALYCAVQHYFSSTRDKMKARRGTLLFVLPALLLLVRVAVEALYRHAYPKWWTTVEGQETLDAMDASLERIFDPNAHLSHLSPLESTSAAIRIAARGSQGLKSNQHRSKWWATSALVASALPTSAIVRRQEVAAAGGNERAPGVQPLPAVATSLPEKARQQLYTAALNRAEAAAARRTHRPPPVERRAAPPAHSFLGTSTSLKELVRAKGAAGNSDAEERVQQPGPAGHRL